MAGQYDPDGIEPLSEEALKAQKSRNLWLALGLVAFVVIVGTVTAIRIGDANLGKDGGFYFSGAMETSQTDAGDSKDE